MSICQIIPSNYTEQREFSPFSCLLWGILSLFAEITKAHFHPECQRYEVQSINILHPLL